MKKAALIFTLGLFVLNCSKRDSAKNIDSSDSLSTDTFSPETVPVESDTAKVSTIAPDSSVTKAHTDSLRIAR